MQARDDTANGNVNEARRTLKMCQLWCIGAGVWVFIAAELLLLILMIVAFSAR